MALRDSENEVDERLSYPIKWRRQHVDSDFQCHRFILKPQLI